MIGRLSLLLVLSLFARALASQALFVLLPLVCAWVVTETHPLFAFPMMYLVAGYYAWNGSYIALTAASTDTKGRQGGVGGAGATENT